MVGIVLGSVQRTISEKPESNVSIESIKTSAGISTNRLRVHVRVGALRHHRRAGGMMSQENLQVDMRLARALQVAIRVHAGRVNKQDEPYLLHVERVVAAVGSYEAKIVAALHGVIEGGESPWHTSHSSVILSRWSPAPSGC